MPVHCLYTVVFQWNKQTTERLVHDFQFGRVVGGGRSSLRLAATDGDVTAVSEWEFSSGPWGRRIHRSLSRPQARPSSAERPSFTPPRLVGSCFLPILSLQVREEVVPTAHLPGWLTSSSERLELSAWFHLLIPHVGLKKSYLPALPGTLLLPNQILSRIELNGISKNNNPQL